MLKEIIWMSIIILLVEGMYSMSWLKENWLFITDIIILKWHDFKNRLGDKINV